MKHIKIFDTTLRDGEQSPGCSMRLSEKLEVALALEKAGVDIIEAGFAIASPGDFESVRAVAETVKNCAVASLCRSKEGDIDASVNALKKAAAPRVHIFLATSPIHMQYKLKMTESEVLESIAASVKYAKKFVSDVEFSAEDASRSDLKFLTKAVETAIKAGAATVNLPDTVGYCVPSEMAEKIRYIRGHAAGAEKITLSAHNHNDLGMGVANSLAVIAAGVTQIECTVNGIGERAGNASMEEIVMALKVRRDIFDADTRIDTTRLYRLSKLIASITGVPVPPTKPIVGANAFAHESGVHQHGVLANKATYEIMRPEDVGIPENKIVLGKHSGKHAFSEHLSALGYTFTAEETAEYFETFKKLCDKKKYVSDKDIIAIVSGARADAEKLYALKDFAVSSGLNSAAAATVVLQSGDKPLQSTMSGDGPVDSAFKAINAIVKREITLDDYFLNSVTEGRDAQAEAVVRLSLDGVKCNGRGVSTDVVEASILAYIDGVNKL